MDKKTEKLELTPEQMDQVTGGLGESEIPDLVCPNCGRRLANALIYLRHVKSCCGENTAPVPDSGGSSVAPAPAPRPDK